MNQINELFKKDNHTLRELLIGIFLWGILLSLLLACTGSFQMPFFVSLWAGVAGAALMAVHMARSIQQSLKMASDDAVKGMKKGTILRMAAVMALFVLAWRLRGDVPGVFLGLITLKLGAYTQPLTHKIMNKKKEGE